MDRNANKRSRRPSSGCPDHDKYCVYQHKIVQLNKEQEVQIMKAKLLIIFLLALAAMSVSSFTAAKDKDEKPDDPKARPTIINQLPGAW
jgi:hypothetical protein